MAFNMASVTKTSEMYGPPKVVVYGVPGLGKTTFGCTFERPILLRTEDGAAALDVATFPSLAESLENVFEAISSLIKEEHGFKTLVVDSLDWMEPLVWNYTSRRLGVESIEKAGYGKGYLEADIYWRQLIGGFEFLRHRREMNIVLIAHSEVKRYEPPDGNPYDRYQIKLHKRGLAILNEWAEMMLFADYKVRTFMVKDGGSKGESKYRAEGSGDRVLFTSKRPALEAKSRWELPHEIYIGQDRTWSAFHYELNKSTGGRYPLPTNLAQQTAQLQAQAQPQPQTDAA